MLGRETEESTHWRRWILSEETNEEPGAGNEHPEKPTGTSESEVIAEKDRKIAELTDDLKRLQADFENFKKRTEREWGERARFANQRLMGDLLAVLDSFDRAIEETKKAGDIKCLEDGLEKVHRQLMQMLEKEGLKEIKAEGKFDPFLHEAIQREENPDAEEGKILEVYQKGYMLGGKALRPAKVKVARKTEPEEAPKNAVECEAKQVAEEDEDQYPVK